MLTVALFFAGVLVFVVAVCYVVVRVAAAHGYVVVVGKKAAMVRRHRWSLERLSAELADIPVDAIVAMYPDGAR